MLGLVAGGLAGREAVVSILKQPRHAPTIRPQPPKARHDHQCPLPSSATLSRLPPSLSWLLWAGAPSYDEWPPHRYQRKKGGPDGGFRWSAGALALSLAPALALAQCPGCWVLGVLGWWALGPRFTALRLPSLPVRV